MNGTNGGKEDGVASKVWRRCNRLFGPDAGVGNKSSVTEPPATGSGPGKEPPKKKNKKKTTQKRKRKKRLNGSLNHSLKSRLARQMQVITGSNGY